MLFHNFRVLILNSNQDSHGGPNHKIIIPGTASSLFLLCFVIVARKDKKDLSPEHYEAIWMYCDYILEYFGNGSAPQHLYNRQAFERWFVVYQKENAGFGRSEWKSVPPLYEA